eukprot:CAMPEP_0183327332 /NCGR_PEP_ID=MMETSP0160_2-20130417/83707_1 /TAXON_ID=2839 ORGANISM="Odontella Sinensis, Strain Grunow 1884" /NCGR_SAMPLE_ID=MMETSP0160_2 /ASSEMBLY_ACC=CAM_ASM_000250 /LENGTH=486 /DNA_ID=CAMNT_0025495457 /DNA_START=1002 /DNA_END=2462 /DNA_ORIENTATION=-
MATASPTPPTATVFGVEWHGHRGDPSWDPPAKTFGCPESVRPDQDNHIGSDEFRDAPVVLAAKVALLADLIRAGRFCVAYTGAGLSRSAGIPDYASKSGRSVSPIFAPFDAQPTAAHRTLAAMERRGHVHHYVQQNHDGLPQKAGFPQEKMNEIHGAWFDPSNPVVQFSESLRGDLFEWMLEVEKKADLCLCLGTSLSGMNADRVAENPAKRSLRGDSRVLGTAIINLQRTRLDKSACLRIWAPLDDVFALLAQELSLDVNMSPPPPAPAVSLVPYGGDGLPSLSTKDLMVLDLSIGKKVRISQPESSKADRVMTVKRHYEDGSIGLSSRGYSSRLGNWWIRGALEGTVQRLPVVNVDPVFHSKQDHQPDKTTKICIIQSHQKLLNRSQNSHNWSLRLDPAGSSLVEAVEWDLHPTFHPPKRTLTNPPFQIEMNGWGTFSVGAKIKLKGDKSGLEVSATHEISFSEEGDAVKITAVDIPEEKRLGS